MNLRRILRILGGLAVVAGLVLVPLPPGGDTGWFTYAPQTEVGNTASLAFPGATLVTDRDLYGYSLLAVAAVITSGLLGYRIGTRRET